MLKALSAILSSLLSLIGGLSIYRHGRLAERERNRVAMEKKLQEARKIENNNVITINDRVKRMQSRHKRK